jgi:hypothetical protein
MCSFRFSPVPTPNEKRPGRRLAAVAAACATIAGWMRVVGQVTPVISSIRSVRWEIALLVDPGVEVVRDRGEGEPDLLGALGLADERRRVELLARERVSELGHDA